MKDNPIEESYSDMYTAIHQDAIWALLMLRREKSKAIDGWECANEWPRSKTTGRRLKILYIYREFSDVRGVLKYFKSGDAQRMLAVFGSEITQEQIMEQFDPKNDAANIEWFRSRKHNSPHYMKVGVKYLMEEV